MDWPSDSFEREIDEALRSDERAGSPLGFYGRVVRAVEAEAQLQRARAAWRWRCAGVLGGYIAVLALLPVLLGAGGALSAWITSIPGGWGRVDHAAYLLAGNLAWIVAAGCVASLGILAGVAQGLSRTSSSRQTI